MSAFTLYGMNLASEVTLSAVLVFLLVTCLLQRNRFSSNRPLLLLTASTLLLLLCQIGEWFLMMASGNQIGLSQPAFRGWKVLTYGMDYFLGQISSIAFLSYVNWHIRDQYLQHGQEAPKPRVSWVKLLLIWAAASTVLFYVLLWQDWFFFVTPAGTEAFHLRAYLYCYALTYASVIAVVAALIRHRKILGRFSFTLLLFYKISPTILLPLDLASGTCLTYLMRAFYTIILYIHVDLRAEQQLIDREAQFARQDKELLELRTKIMLSQMQPHFLYNTLATISGLCFLENAQQAREVVDKFADYFRQNLDSMGKDVFIPFEKELEHIQTYLWLEQVRFGDALVVEYNIGPSSFQIPSLTLQPLVENAVKHGIRKKKGGGTVTVETVDAAGEYIVIVRDNGAGFDPCEAPDDTSRSHVGIENITQRLEALCGGHVEIRSQKGVGTVVTVHIPKEEA